MSKIEQRIPRYPMTITVQRDWRPSPESKESGCIRAEWAEDRAVLVPISLPFLDDPNLEQEVQGWKNRAIELAELEIDLERADQQG